VTLIATIGRSVPEWVGSSPDAKVPDHVRVRIFDRAKGICHITGRKIRAGEKWEIEHVTPLADGGEHRESNLAPALKWAHQEKTRAEATSRAKVRRIRKKHIGASTTKRPMQGSRASGLKKLMNGKVERR
jgi:5-methylcytosine-specific restriction endonuclease McrA